MTVPASPARCTTNGQIPAAWVLLALLLAAVLLPMAAMPVHAQEAAHTREHGYIDLPDGIRLKYTVLLPAGDGPWPVLMQYEGYNAGSFPARANATFVDRMLGDGYAVLGVSVRGTACSGGVFDVFEPQWGADGAFAVDWAAAQPWSDGRIGMFSLSFAGIMQLWTAAFQPDHLVAIAPGQVIADVYRDVGYPGGMLNAIFPGVWMAALHQTWVEPTAQAVADGDAECLANIASHPLLNAPTSFAIEGLQRPYDDEWHRERSVDRLLDRIEVPFLGMQSWQDEQTGPRGAYHMDHLDPERSWFVSGNGQHGLYSSSPRWHDMLHAYFDHFLKGIDNGFDRRPRVEVWHEVSATTFDPSWVTTTQRWPIHRVPLRLHLHDDGVLSDQASADEGDTSYLYPVPGPDVVWDLGQPSTWTHTPIVPEGTAAWTTGPLPQDLTFVGEASADLWITTASPDVDLQVTVTEVRPDGQEVYVQRGWLRLSHQALDEQRSTELRPFHPHTESSLQDPSSDTPQLARVEVLPFGHTFREGSAIRLLVDTPSVTGLWGFEPVAGAGQVTIHHDADHPSALVLGWTAGEAATALPDCGALWAQPCRPDPLGVPDVDGPLAPTDTSAPTDDPTGDEDTPPETASPPLPATGSATGTAAIAAVAVALLACGLRRRQRTQAT